MMWEKFLQVWGTGCVLYFIAYVKGFTNFSMLIQVPTGYVAVEYQFGKLLDRLHDPGFSLVGPFSKSHFVQTSVQTDEVNNIPCGTKGGVMIYFDKIEVVNILHKDSVIETVKNYTIDYDKIWIYNKVHNEINQYCSQHTLTEVYITNFDQLDENLMEALEESAKKWAPGIQLLSIRVTKPKIPITIQEKFIDIEKAKATEKTLIEKHHTLIQKQETELQKKLSEKERGLDIIKINLIKEYERKTMNYDMAIIENEIYFQKEETELNAYEGREMTRIDGLLSWLNEPTMKKIEKESLLNNSMLYIGDSIPQYIAMGGKNQ